MTDDDREPFEPGDIDSQEDDAGDPAQAFEALRQTVEDLADDLSREMTTIRKGVEAAFEEFDKFQQPADYSADLGRIVQQLATVSQQLEAVETSPILKNGPEHYARALERSGESLVQTAAQQFQHESRDFQRVAHELAGQVKSARARHIQNRTLWSVGAAGIVAGILLTLFLPAVLPFSAAPRVASLVMGQDQWSAGSAMIESANPKDWRVLETGGWLYQNNFEALDGCISAMQAAGEAQSCTITVPAP